MDSIEPDIDDSEASSHRFAAEAAYADSMFRSALGDWAGSVESLERALEFDPGYAPAILSVGSVEYQRDRKTKGRRLFHSLFDLPDDTEVLAGQPADTVVTFKRAKPGTGGRLKPYQGVVNEDPAWRVELQFDADGGRRPWFLVDRCCDNPACECAEVHVASFDIARATASLPEDGGPLDLEQRQVLMAFLAALDNWRDHLLLRRKLLRSIARRWVEFPAGRQEPPSSQLAVPPVLVREAA